MFIWNHGTTAFTSGHWLFFFWRLAVGFARSSYPKFFLLPLAFDILRKLERDRVREHGGRQKRREPLVIVKAARHTQGTGVCLRFSSLGDNSHLRGDWIGWVDYVCRQMFVWKRKQSRPPHGHWWW